MFSSAAATPATKRERTRAHLREVALRSFRERGYDATTIRSIAAEAGVSVGTTNYHFASKSDLIQELYVDVQVRHRDAAGPRLAASTDFIERLRIVYTTGLDELGPYHDHAAEFVAAALAPRSAVNPLSAESAPARDITQALFREAVVGAKHSLPPDLVVALPGALFVSHLLLALSWTYDRSPDQERTRRLLDRGLALLKLSLPLARLPLLHGPLTELATLVGETQS